MGQGKLIYSFIVWCPPPFKASMVIFRAKSVWTSSRPGKAEEVGRGINGEVKGSDLSPGIMFLIIAFIP